MKITLAKITSNITTQVNICKMSIETSSKLANFDRDVQDRALVVFSGLITEKEAINFILNKY